MYADYTFYTESFFGSKIPEDAFPYFAARATDYINSLDFDEAKADETALANCCCACAEVLYAAAPEQSKTSEKVGDYSVTYGSSQLTTAEQLLTLAGRYLDIRSVGWL